MRCVSFPLSERMISFARQAGRKVCREVGKTSTFREEKRTEEKRRDTRQGCYFSFFEQRYHVYPESDGVEYK